MDFQLLEEVRKINETQREVFFNKVRSALWTLRGKRLAALGLAFKGDTDDIRESPAIEIIKKLLQAGAIVTAYDPAAMERAKEVLPPADESELCRRSLRGGEGCRRGADSDRLEGVCRDRSGAAQPGRALPDRDRRAQPV